jgi:hypothetical protein
MSSFDYLLIHTVPSFNIAAIVIVRFHHFVVCSPCHTSPAMRRQAQNANLETASLCTLYCSACRSLHVLQDDICEELGIEINLPGRPVLPSLGHSKNVVTTTACVVYTKSFGCTINDHYAVSETGVYGVSLLLILCAITSTYFSTKLGNVSTLGSQKEYANLITTVACPQSTLSVLPQTNKAFTSIYDSHQRYYFQNRQNDLKFLLPIS